MNEYRTKINERVLENRRIALGLTITDIIRGADISRSTYYRIVQNSVNKIDILKKLANVLEMDWRDLIIDN